MVRRGAALAAGAALLAGLLAPVGEAAAAAAAACARFAKPLVLPGSAGIPGALPVAPGGAALAVEPSIASGPHGELYVTGETALSATFAPHVPRGDSSPVWVSPGGGRDWSGPYDSATVATADPGFAGFDSDVVVDKRGWLYVASMWWGDTTMAVSTDKGRTWFAVPVSHLMPLDDRPWLAYDPHDDALYLTWDGIDGLHVAKAVLRPYAAGTAAQPYASLAFAQDVIVVPITGTQIVGGSPPHSEEVQATPPGGITVDPRGNVWVSFNDSSGNVAVVGSTDGGLLWSAPAEIPGSGTFENSAVDNFAQLHADARGNVYVAWSGAEAYKGPGEALYSWRNVRTGRWSQPIRVSRTNTVGYVALAVVSPGVVDIAYYGADQTGSSARWSIYLAQSRVGHPTALDTALAYPDFYSGEMPNEDYLGDFFTMTVSTSGLARIITDATVDGRGVLALVLQTAAVCPRRAG